MSIFNSLRNKKRSENYRTLLEPQQFVSEETKGSEFDRAFTRLKVALSLLVEQKRNRGSAILCASPNGEEGRTNMAINLTLSCASPFKKAILVDADLRRGKATKIFGLEEEKGLFDYLLGEATIEEIIHPLCNTENAFFIPCGMNIHKPFDLLADKKMKSLLSALRKEHSFIFFDTTPMLVHTDALALAPITDGSIVVGKQNKTREEEMRQTVSLLKQYKSNVLGLVFTDYKKRR